MVQKARVFLDTSALFAGVWSSEGGGRVILKLGEAGMLQLLTSSQVLSELESGLDRRDPRLVPQVALVLDRSMVTITDPAPLDRVLTCLALVDHHADARVLAGAWGDEAKFFVTLNQTHFLDNEPLRTALPFPLGTPGDFLAWYRDRLGS